MSAPEGENQVELDAIDQARIDSAMAPDASDAFLGGVLENVAQVGRIVAGAARKAELASAINAGSAMRVEPDQVDELARFFESKATEMNDRSYDVQMLAYVSAPGTDPVSSQVVDAYGKVGAGDSNAYYENYIKLAEVFTNTAANLRASAAQVRTNDQDAADSFGGNLAQ
ncbi:hypothetical protein [Saccharopolyspora sp. CA-218241]|uniref:hypothetical protein n=1 Tax=Saccharopolyspora sp. CA-218241 TaxID=3240027 RepID=UPI003D96BC1E